MHYYFDVQVDAHVAGEFDVEEFARQVVRILGLPQGWRRWGFGFTRVFPDEAGAKQMRQRRGLYFTIKLAHNTDVIELGGLSFDGMSVADCSENLVRINADRWRGGAKPNPSDAVSGMPLSAYRQYVVLHEVGHILSQCSPTHHQRACAPCGRAPVMMQQTNGVGKCQWNPWPVAGVDEVEPLAYAAQRRGSDS